VCCHSLQSVLGTTSGRPQPLPLQFLRLIHNLFFTYNLTLCGLRNTQFNCNLSGSIGGEICVWADAGSDPLDCACLCALCRECIKTKGHCGGWACTVTGFTYILIPCKTPVVHSSRTNNLQNPYELAMHDLLAMSFSVLLSH
jgi:hypothetical protein